MREIRLNQCVHPSGNGKVAVRKIRCGSQPLTDQRVQLPKRYRMRNARVRQHAECVQTRDDPRTAAVRVVRVQVVVCGVAVP